MCVCVWSGGRRFTRNVTQNVRCVVLASQFISGAKTEMAVELTKAFMVKENFIFMASPPFPCTAIVGEMQAQQSCMVVLKRLYDLSS